MRNLLLTSLICLIPSMASGGQVDLRKLAEESAGQYLEGITKTVMPNINIDLPEQLDLGIRNSSYKFETGTSVHWRTRDPLSGIKIERGNQNYQINQSGLTFGYSKTLDMGWWSKD